MNKENTSIRLKRIMSERNIKQVDILRMCEPYYKKYHIKLNKNDLSQYVSGKVSPGQNKLFILGQALNVNEAWLMGYDVPMERNDNKSDDKLNPPTITEDFTTFPVIGEVAAGYEYIAVEDWEGDTVDIPNTYLNGRKKDDFFVLRVKGDSMFPMYQENDKVLILKQTTMDYSGQIGVVMYDDDKGTLKKVEYAMGEDWMRLVPINPNHPIVKIENEGLEHCRILGIPKLMLREIVD